MRPIFSSLRAVKIVHTLVWALFVVVILAIPVCGWFGKFHWAAWCAAVILGEVLILAANGWRCPLTAVAARFTPDRSANFDIYLPEWLARHNKLVFGALYLLGSLLAFGWWRGWLPR